MYGLTPLGRRGFTLVELLVVIAILAVLAALLLPSLKQALEMSRRAVCMSNLRQIGVGLLNYGGDFDGRYPPTNYYISRTVRGNGGWNLNILGNLAASPAFGNTAQTVSEYTGIETWFCPSNDRHPIGNVVGWPDRRANFTYAHQGNWYGSTHYLLAWGVRAWHLDNGYDTLLPEVAGRVNDPPGAVLVGDCWGYNVMDVTIYLGESRLANHPGKGTSHPGYFAGGNYLFNDGHVRWHGLEAGFPSGYRWMSALPGHALFYPLPEGP